MNSLTYEMSLQAVLFGLPSLRHFDKWARTKKNPSPVVCDRIGGSRERGLTGLDPPYHARVQPGSPEQCWHTLFYSLLPFRPWDKTFHGEVAAVLLRFEVPSTLFSPSGEALARFLWSYWLQ